MRVAYINCLLSKGGALGIEKKLAAQGKAIAQLGLNLDVFYFNFHQVFHDGAFSFQRLQPGFPREILLTLSRYTRIPAHLALDDYDLLLLRYSRADFSVFSRFFQHFRERIVTEHHTKELSEAFTYKTTLPQKMTTLFMERFLGPRMIRGCAGLIGVTGEIREYEIERCGCRIPSCTVPNGVLVEEVPFSGHAPYDGDVLNLLCLANRFETWQGLDRILTGLRNYRSRKPRLHVRIVGTVSPMPSALLRHLEHHPCVRVDFLGTLQGAELEEVFRMSHIAFSSLALFRKGMKEACALKTREFTARGIPFVIGYSDPDFKEGADEFLLTVPAENSPIEMEEVVAFAERVLKGNEIPEVMRGFSEKRLDWTIKMRQVWEFLKSVPAGKETR